MSIRESSLGANRFKQSFFEADTVSLARALIGKRLVSLWRGRRTAGMIVEVEAYLGANDPACHAARGMTRRNAVMFRSPGHCYVYLIYGMYHCVNVVSDPAGVGSAVLIRAIQPLEGLDVMARRREQPTSKQLDLARGPGRLCEAMAITTALSGEHFATSQRIWLEPYEDISPRNVACSGRIGITAGSELPLRFFLRDNVWVSGPRVLSPLRGG